MNGECWWIDSSPPPHPYSRQTKTVRFATCVLDPHRALTQSSQGLPKSATSSPKLKLTKSDGIWRSSDTTNPTSSQLPLCPSCDMPLQDHQHQCDAAGDQTTEKQLESASDQGPDENSFSEKKHILQIKTFMTFSVINSLTVWLIARYCFIHCLCFLLMMNNETLPDNYLKIFLQQWN